MLISGDFNYDMYVTLGKCNSWEDLEKTNYTNYLDETFSEYVKSIYNVIDGLKNKVFKLREFEENSIESQKINNAKLIELKKCNNWQDLKATGYAQHIDNTFRAYMINLYDSLIDLTKNHFDSKEINISMLEKNLLLKNVVNLGRGNNPTDKVEEISVENLAKYANETLIGEMPLDIGLSILQFLPPNDICKISRVCKEWYKLTWHNEIWKNYDLKKLYPNLNFIAQKDWEKHVDLKSLELSFNGNPGVHKRNLLPILKELFALNVNGVTLITLPEGLNEEKILKIAGKSYDDPYIYQDLPLCKESSRNTKIIKKTEIVAVTNSVIKDSKHCTPQNITKLKEPDHLSILANILLTNVTSNEFLYLHERNYNDNEHSGLVVTSSHRYLGYKWTLSTDKPTFMIRNDWHIDDEWDFGIGVTREIKPDVIDNTISKDVR